MEPVSFTARVITGAGRGKDLQVPTLNLDLRDVPAALPEGIFACTAAFGGVTHKGAMHHGPRPVFQDTTACEIHILDEIIEVAPESVSVTVVQKIRDVADFPSPEELKAQIAEDIRQVKAILA